MIVPVRTVTIIYHLSTIIYKESINPSSFQESFVLLLLLVGFKAVEVGGDASL